MYTRTHIHTNSHYHTHTYIHTPTLSHTHIHPHARTLLSHTHIHTYTHTLSHTHTHTHVHVHLHGLHLSQYIVNCSLYYNHIVDVTFKLIYLPVYSSCPKSLITLFSCKIRLFIVIFSTRFFDGGGRAVQYSAVQYRTVQYRTVQCSAVQYTALHYDCSTIHQVLYIKWK